MPWARMHKVCLDLLGRLTRFRVMPYFCNLYTRVGRLMPSTRAARDAKQFRFHRMFWSGRAVHGDVGHIGALANTALTEEQHGGVDLFRCHRCRDVDESGGQGSEEASEGEVQSGKTVHRLQVCTGFI